MRTRVEVVDEQKEPCLFSELGVGEWFRSPRWGIMLKVSDTEHYKPSHGIVDESNWDADDLVRVTVKIVVVG